MVASRFAARHFIVGLTVVIGAVSAPAVAQTGSICGDCDGDRQQTIIDAFAAMQLAVGLSLPTPERLARCDVHPSQGVSSLDGLLLAQAAVGLSTITRCLPQCQITAPTSGTQMADVAISYTLFHAGSLVASISPSFSTDGGITFATATMGAGGEGITGLATSGSGSAHTFVWASDVDLEGTTTTVFFRIVVTNANGTSSCLTGFDIDNPPLFDVLSITPATGPVLGGQQVLIIGHGFLPGAIASIDGVSCFNTNIISSTVILATTPRALAGRAGIALDVAVDVGGPTATLAMGYTYDPDTTRPFVLSMIPPQNSTGNRINTKVTVIFSEPMNQSSVIFNCTGAANVVSFFAPPSTIDPCPSTYMWAEGGDRFTYDRLPNPAGAGTQHTHINRNPPPTVADLHGNLFDPTPFAGPIYDARFTVTVATDAVAPTVASTNPAAGATGVPVDLEEIVVNFSEAMDAATLGAGSFEVRLAGTPIAGRRSFSLSGTTARFRPQRVLAASTVYEIFIGAATDMAGLPLPSFSATFTTAATDTFPPTIDFLTLNGIPAEMNGTGAAGGTLQTPQVGFTIDVDMSDIGGSGLDAPSIEISANVPLGGGAPTGFDAGESFGFLCSTTYATATITIAASLMGRDLTFPPGAVTLSARVADGAGNFSALANYSFLVTSATSANRPFEMTGRWQLRFNQDFSSPTTADMCTPTCRHLTGFGGANGVADWLDDLVLYGFRIAGAPPISPTGGMTTAEVADAEIRRRIIEILYEKHGVPIIGGVPTPGPDSTNVDFTEAVPAAPFSVIDIGGSITPFPTLYGFAQIDARNSNFANMNLRSGGFGVFPGNQHRGDSNPCVGNTLWPNIFNPINPVCGVAVGNDVNDPFILDPTFDRSDVGNPLPQNARYDIVFLAIESFARSVAAITAHEIGHSQGLSRTGDPPVGLFGNDASFPGSTDHHVELIAAPEFSSIGCENTMRPGSLFALRMKTGSGFSRLVQAYYRERLLSDP